MTRVPQPSGNPPAGTGRLHVVPPPPIPPAESGEFISLLSPLPSHRGAEGPGLERSGLSASRQVPTRGDWERQS